LAFKAKHGIKWIQPCSNLGKWSSKSEALLQKNETAHLMKLSVDQIRFNARTTYR
jgi:hypothetical protein